MAEGGDSPSWVVETQQTLGELIKRPKLTEALLQKPPFRFLHDVVSEVTKVTGFASGLYQEDELNSAKIKDKDSKLAYLAKIIKCVEFALNTSISIRVGKWLQASRPRIRTCSFSCSTKLPPPWPTRPRPSRGSSLRHRSQQRLSPPRARRHRRHRRRPSHTRLPRRQWRRSLLLTQHPSVS